MSIGNIINKNRKGEINIKEDNMSTKTKTKPRKEISPTLKSAYFRRGKLARVFANYGASVSVNDIYTISPPKTPMGLSEEAEMQYGNLPKKDNSPKAKKKKKLLNFLYFALNIAVIAIVLGIQLSKEQNPLESLSEIQNANWWFIFAAFGCVAVGMLLEQIRTSCLITNTTKVFRPALGYKVASLGRFYDVITPLSTGGQPFQILYMSKYGIKVGEGVSVAMGKYIFSQIIFFLWVTFFLMRNLLTGGTQNISSVAGGVATTFTWIGYAVLAVVIVTILLISLNKRFGASVVVGILKLLSRIHIGKFRIIKDYKKTFRSVMRTVNIWQTTTKQYSRSPWVLFVSLFGSLVFYAISYSMPFFLYSAFAGWHPEMWVEIVTIAVMIDMSSAFNPIPMGTGTADLSFTTFFSSLFIAAGLGTGVQIWALLIWRFFTYYIFILQGTFILVYDIAIGDKRLEKNKEYWTIPVRERRKIKAEIKAKAQK